MAKKPVASVPQASKAVATVVVLLDSMLVLAVARHRTNHRATRHQDSVVMLLVDSVVQLLATVVVLVDSNRRHPHSNRARMVVLLADMVVLLADMVVLLLADMVVLLVDSMLLVLLSAALTATTTAVLIAMNSTDSTNKVYKQPDEQQRICNDYPSISA